MPASPSSFLSLSLSAVALAGCALVYTPTLKPGPDTALLRAGSRGGVYRGGSVSIVSVSGATPHWTDTRQMVISPGKRQGEFQVKSCRARRYFNDQQVAITDRAASPPAPAMAC